MAKSSQPGQDPAPRTGADPRRGRNPGYAEERPGNADQAHQPAEPARPNTDEPGINRDTDAHPTP